MSDAAQLLDALSHLIGTVIWPAVLLFVVLRFRTQFAVVVADVRKIIAAREFTMKAGPSGVELTAGARTAAALLEEVEATRDAADASTASVGPAVRDAVDALEAMSQVGSQPPKPRLLWVDDRPENNRFEQRAFREIGFGIEVATSTDDALELLSRERFDVVISDMGRPPDMRAGYTLLDEMRRRGNRTPFVIYAGSRAPDHVAEARRHGAVGTTNRATELVQLVTQALSQRESGGV